MHHGAVGVDEAADLGTAGKPGLHPVPQGRPVVGGDPVHADRLAAGIHREAGRGNPRVDLSLGIGSLRPRNVLGFHLHRVVGQGGAAIEKLPAQARIGHRGTGPEVRGDEGHRPFEVPRVEEQGP